MKQAACISTNETFLQRFQEPSPGYHTWTRQSWTKNPVVYSGVERERSECVPLITLLAPCLPCSALPLLFHELWYKDAGARLWTPPNPITARHVEVPWWADGSKALSELAHGEFKKELTAVALAAGSDGGTVSPVAPLSASLRGEGRA